MKLKPLSIGLAAAGLLGAAGYGLYAMGMNRGMGMATAPASASGGASNGSDAGLAAEHRRGRGGHAPSHRLGHQGRRGRPRDGQEGPLLPRPDGAGQQVREAGQVAVHGHDVGARLCRWRQRRQQGHGQPAHPAEPGRAHGCQVTEGTLSPQVSAVGSIAFNERDQVIVQARATGYVERLNVRATLDRVAKGQAAGRAVCAGLDCGAGRVPVRAPDARHRPRGTGRRRAPAHAPGRHERQRRSRWSKAAGRTQPRIHACRTDRRCRHRVDGARRHDGDGRRHAVPHQRHSAPCGPMPKCQRARQRCCGPAPRSKRRSPAVPGAKFDGKRAGHSFPRSTRRRER